MTLNTIKNIVIAVCIIALIGLGIWSYKEYQFNKDKSARLEENNRQERLSDSLKYSSVKLDKAQMELYLHDNKKLLDIIKKSDIRFERVNSVLNHLLKFRDTTIVNTDLSEVLLAINKSESYKQSFIDSSECLINKGFISFERPVDGNPKLSLVFTGREFTGNTTVIGYWERRQWKFLGIKTRFLGKKQASIKVIDKCGESKTIEVSLDKK